MGTGAFQPGPAADLPDTVADAAFAVANVVPDTAYATKDYSRSSAIPTPARRRRWRGAARARRLTPGALHQPAHRRTGMALMDCFLVQLDPGTTTLPFRTSANSVCCVWKAPAKAR